MGRSSGTSLPEFSYIRNIGRSSDSQDEKGKGGIEFTTLKVQQAHLNGMLVRQNASLRMYGHRGDHVDLESRPLG